MVVQPKNSSSISTNYVHSFHIVNHHSKHAGQEYAQRTQSIISNVVTFLTFSGSYKYICLMQLSSIQSKVVPMLNALSITPWRPRGSGCIDPRTVNLRTSWMWSASRPCRFTPSTHWIVAWVGPIVGLYDMERRKILPLLELELRLLGPASRNKSLYRLRFPGSILFTKQLLKYPEGVLVKR
jgi:hypothetical protein